MNCTSTNETLDKIPADILTNIARYLDKYDRRNLRSVSKVWRNVVDSEELWKDRKVSLHHMEFYPIDVWNTLNLRGITSLVLKSTCKTDHNNKLGLVFSHLHNLKYLELDCVFLHDFAINPYHPAKTNQVEKLRLTISKHKKGHRCAEIGASRQWFPQLQCLWLIWSNKLQRNCLQQYDRNFRHSETYPWLGKGAMTVYQYECTGSNCIYGKCKNDLMYNRLTFRF